MRNKNKIIEDFKIKYSEKIFKLEKSLPEVLQNLDFILSELLVSQIEQVFVQYTLDKELFVTFVDKTVGLEIHLSCISRDNVRYSIFSRLPGSIVIEKHNLEYVLSQIKEYYKVLYF